MPLHKLDSLGEQGASVIIELNIEGVECDDVGHLVRRHASLRSVARTTLSERLAESQTVKGPLE